MYVYMSSDMIIDMLSRSDLSKIILDRYQNSEEPKTIKTAIDEAVQGSANCKISQSDKNR